MEYIYQQQIKPTNVKGVQVHLTAIDPNGNYQDIGTVTSDINGQFSTLWTPPVDGKYTLTATFEGTKSYSTSSAQTAFAVSKSTAAPIIVPTPPAPTPAQTVTPTSTPTQTTPPTPTVALPPASNPTSITTYLAIGTAVIIIIAAAAVLVLRRRK